MTGSDNDGDAVIAMAWYKPSQWERLEEIAPDIKQTWQSYEEWHMTATRHLSKLKMSGRPAEKVEIDVEDLLIWCQERDRPVDGAARAEYAAEKLRETYGG